MSGKEDSSHIGLYKDQIRVLVMKDFKLKYNSTALGFLWSLLVPALTSVVYYFVFGIMLRFNAPNYLLFLLSGTFLWQFFANVVMMNGNVLSANVGLLKKTNFNRELLVWGTFFTESIHFLLTVPVLLAMMLFYRVVPNPAALLNFVVALGSLLLLSVGLSYAYAAANLFFRDLERIMTIVMMMWMFSSPVFIPISAVEQSAPQYLWVYKVNPMALILGAWRDIFYQPAFHPKAYLPMVAFGVVALVFGRWMFKKMEPGFAEMM